MCWISRPSSRRRSGSFTRRRRQGYARAGAASSRHIPPVISPPRNGCWRRPCARHGCTAGVCVVLVRLRRGRAAAGHGGCAARPLSPYGVTKLAAEHLCALYAHSFACPPSHCATSPSTGRASGRIWRSIVSARRCCKAVDRRLRRRPADARLHLRRRIVEANAGQRALRAWRARSSTSPVDRGLAARRDRDDGDGQRADGARAARAGGARRRARHRRRHVQGAADARLRSHGRATAGGGGRVGVSRNALRRRSFYSQRVQPYRVAGERVRRGAGGIV